MFDFKWYANFRKRRADRKIESRIYGLDLVKRVLLLRQQLIELRKYGIYRVYFSHDLDVRMEAAYSDFSSISVIGPDGKPYAPTNLTSRQRVCMINGIVSCEMDWGMEPNSIRIAQTYAPPAKV